MTAPPRAVVRAAQALGLDPAGLRSLGGASGSAWGVGDQVLRVGPRDLMDAELAAAAAASAVLPVPAVLDRAEVDGDLAVRLERRPGCPVVEVLQQHPGLARAVGEACGAVHQVLTLDPIARSFRAQPVFAALADAWLGRGQLAQAAPAARAWACRFMLGDLGGRYSPADLAHIREAYEGLRQRTAST